MPVPEEVGSSAAAGSASPLPPQQGQGLGATGPGSATQPSPDLGKERMALTGIGMLAQQIGRLVPALTFGSDAHRDISEALNKIAKYARVSGVGVGEEQAQLQKMAIEARQRQSQMQGMMPQQQRPGMPPQAAGAGMAGAMQQQQGAA